MRRFPTDESLDAEGPAETAGDEGEEMTDEDDLYSDLAEFMRPPDAVKGPEGDGGGKGDGILSAELNKLLGTMNESHGRKRDEDDDGGNDDDDDDDDGAGKGEAAEGGEESINGEGDGAGKKKRTTRQPYRT